MEVLPTTTCMFEFLCYTPSMPHPCLADQQRDVLAAIAAEEVLEAQAFARQMRLRATADGLWEDGPDAFAVLELAGTARIGQVRAATQLAQGRRLVQLFPLALGLLESGEMYRESACLLLSLTVCCTEAVQAAVGERITAKIAGLNTTDARKVITRAVLQVEAETDLDLTRERLERAKRNRAVWTGPMPDDMLRVTADLTAITGRRWALDFEELIRAQKIADSETGRVRTQAQRRADVFSELPSRVIALLHLIQQGRVAELLTAAAHAAAGPVVAAAPPLPPGATPFTHKDLTQRDLTHEDLLIGLLQLRVRQPVTITIHIPMTTLLELDHRAGYLEGYGPVTAEHTRLLVPMAGLRQLYVAQDSGLPLALDPVTLAPMLTDPPDAGDPEATQEVAGAVRDRLLAMLTPHGMAQQTEPRHDPSPGLKAFVETRDQTCVGIGCSSTAARSDKDHETRWPDGPTAAWNLSSKSPRCHHAKHTGWTVTRIDTGPAAGTTTWTSPLGHTYTTPGVWTAPTRLPQHVQLPQPRYSNYSDRDPDRGDPNDPRHDHPLIAEPPPASRIETTTTWNNDWDDEAPF